MMFVYLDFTTPDKSENSFLLPRTYNQRLFCLSLVKFFLSITLCTALFAGASFFLSFFCSDGLFLVRCPTKHSQHTEQNSESYFVHVNCAWNVQDVYTNVHRTYWMVKSLGTQVSFRFYFVIDRRAKGKIKHMFPTEMNRGSRRRSKEREKETINWWTKMLSYSFGIWFVDSIQMHESKKSILLQSHLAVSMVSIWFIWVSVHE